MVVLVVCYVLRKARGDTIQDDINAVMLCHLGIDIKSIDII